MLGIGGSLTGWYCIPCGCSNFGQAIYCTACGRHRDDATDAARWKQFFTLDAEIAPEPEGELLCDTCGRRFADGSDPCDDCREDCPHARVEKDDDGRDRWFYVCLDCDKVVELSEPDENGRCYWEEVTE